MQLKSLDIYSFRNIEYLKINPSAKFNLIYGENGSGKTSVLEAIYLLGMGRSFRTASPRKVIQNTQEKLTIHAVINDLIQDNTLTIGMEKDISGNNRLRLSNQDVSITEIMRLLPIQMINYDSFDLLNAHSKIRRQFFDWGMFHVKHEFLEVWRKFNAILQQRNKALQNKADRQEINAWDAIYQQCAEQVHAMRKTTFSVFIDYVNAVMKAFEVNDINLTYSCGWDEQENLLELLNANFYKDTYKGYTQYGPHRADLIIKSNNALAKDVLSRGQQKVLIAALKLAQLLMLKTEANKRSVVLIDDLPAELDNRNFTKILTYLNKTESQSFITLIDPTVIKHQLGELQHEMFHVKHGKFI